MITFPPRCRCRSRRDFEFKLLTFDAGHLATFSTELKRERHALVRSVRARIERVSHAGNRIVNKDRLYGSSPAPRIPRPFNVCSRRVRPSLSR